MKPPSFLLYFKKIKDPRQSWKINYPLNEILLLLLTATIAGSEGFQDITDYGKTKLTFLKQYLPYTNGFPSWHTLKRVIEALEPKAFRTCLIHWMSSLQRELAQHIAIDGKCLRHSFSTQAKPIHLVSAWGSQTSCLLAQCRVSEKSNEITAIPEVLALLALQDAVVTIDAMGCQHAVAQQIQAQGGHYVLALKGNQSTLHEDVVSFLEQQRLERFRFIEGRWAVETTVEKGHGRVETRRCWVVEDVAWLRARHPAWCGVGSVVCLESERVVKGVVSRECRYYLSSLVGCSAKAMGGYIRRHWAIENECHWVLDVVFGEDRCRVREGYGAENLHMVRQVAMSCIRGYVGGLSRRLSLRRAVKLAGWDNSVMGAILCAK